MSFDFKKFTTRPKMPTKVMLTIRVVLGLYLYYLVYEIRDALFAEEKDYFLLGAMVLFIIAGGILILFSAKDLLTGRYLGGPLDKDKAENNEECTSEESSEVTDTISVSDENKE